MSERLVGAHNPFLKSVQEYLRGNRVNYVVLKAAEISVDGMLEDSDVGKLLALRAVGFDGRRLVGEAEDRLNGMINILDVAIEAQLRVDLSMSHVKSGDEFHELFQPVEIAAIEAAKRSRAPFLAGANLALARSNNKGIAEPTVFWPSAYEELATQEIGNKLIAFLERKKVKNYGFFLAMHFLTKVPDIGYTFAIA